MDTIWLDILSGIRQLRRARSTSWLIILTLALGIGFVASAIEIVGSVLLSPLPYKNPDQIVAIDSLKNGIESFTIPREFVFWKRYSRSFDKMAAMEPTTCTLGSASTVMQIPCGQVSSDYFDVFSEKPLLGRTFQAADDVPPAQHLAIISAQLWKSEYRSNRNIIGNSIQLNREPYTVIGVMPPSFNLQPNSELVWMPLGLGAQELQWDGGVLSIIGLLKSGASLSQAQADIDHEATLLARQNPATNISRSAKLQTLTDKVVGDYRLRLWLVFISVSAVFLIACTNTANIVLARTTSRNLEIATRMALGATRKRLIRQILIETSLLGLSGSIFGACISAMLLKLVQAFGSQQVPRLAEAHTGSMWLCSLFCLSTLATGIIGLFPSIHASKKGQIAGVIKTARSTISKPEQLARAGYLVAEICLATILLFLSGLLLRTAIRAQSVSPGYSQQNAFAVRTYLPSTIYSDRAKVIGTYERLIAQLDDQPQLRDASLSSAIPFGAASMGINIQSRDNPLLRNDISTRLQFISPEYFRALGVGLVSGRSFTSADRNDTLPVAMVNKSLADLLRRSSSNPSSASLRIPLLAMTDSPDRQIVGVVSDVRVDGLMRPVPPTIYLPLTQVSTNAWHWADQSLYIVVDSMTGDKATSNVVQSALRAIDAGLPFNDPATMKKRLDLSLGMTRAFGAVIAALSLLALMLTVMGVYGVLSYSVAQSQKEMAIRLAIGASRWHIVSLVMGDGLKPVIIGVTIGVSCSLLLGQILRSVLFNITFANTSNIVITVGLILGSASIAAAYPSISASRVAPVTVLRS